MKTQKRRKLQIDMNEEKLSFFIRTLLNWHKKYRRKFIWRENADPYIVFLAALMLVRTKARQVEKVLREFLSRYPTLEDAARGSAEEQIKILSRLGLTRTRGLLVVKAIRYVYNELGGKFPRDESSLMEIPGVGRYVASAVKLFAFGDPVPLLDGPIARVLIRYFGIDGYSRRPSKDPLMWSFAEQILPHKNAKEYNEAILDLSEFICKPKPICSKCPLRKYCSFYQNSSNTNK